MASVKSEPTSPDTVPPTVYPLPQVTDTFVTLAAATTPEALATEQDCVGELGCASTDTE
jgi:hypothetical protein